MHGRWIRVSEGWHVWFMRGTWHHCSWSSDRKIPSINGGYPHEKTSIGMFTLQQFGFQDIAGDKWGFNWSSWKARCPIKSANYATVCGFGIRNRALRFQAFSRHGSSRSTCIEHITNATSSYHRSWVIHPQYNMNDACLFFIQPAAVPKVQDRSDQRGPVIGQHWAVGTIFLRVTRFESTLLCIIFHSQFATKAIR